MESTRIEAADSPVPRPRRSRWIIALLSWLYAIEIIAAWIFLRFEGDRSALGTIAIFSPRWVVILPLVLLVPLAIAFNRRCIWILAVATIYALFWVMGLCLPWRPLFARGNSTPAVRVLTCNVHGEALHPRQLADLIAAAHPDIVVLQEWSAPYEFSIFNEDNWNVINVGQQCLATRFRIDAAQELPNAAAVQYTLETPSGRINLFSVHLASPHPALFDAVHGMPNGQADLEQNVLDREAQSRELNRLTRDVSGPLLIAGDFNLCPDSPIFRENFRKFSDAFDAAGFGFGPTYRVQWIRMRIDHILSNSRWVCRDCWVGMNVGSPHRPLIADFSMSSAP